MSVTLEPMLIILGMAIATYLTRSLGYWWIGRRPVAPWLKDVLEAVPGAVLVAVIAPAILMQGWAGIITGAVTILAAWRLPLLAVVALAVITAASTRALLP